MFSACFCFPSSENPFWELETGKVTLEERVEDIVLVSSAGEGSSVTGDKGKRELVEFPSWDIWLESTLRA